MHRLPEQDGGGCGGNCGGCAAAAPETGHPAPELAGWRFAGWSAAVFLFPLLLAIVGALAAGPGQSRQVGGAAAGLLAGALIARLFAHRSLARNPEGRTSRT